MSLQDNIYAASTPRGSMEDVIDYFKQEYPGEKTNKNGVTTYEWRGKFADYASKELGIKRDSVMRRFQGGRAEKAVSPKHQGEYQALGTKLPPKAPSGGFHFHGTIKIQYSPGKWYDREIDETISGPDADRMVGMDNQDMMQALSNYYQTESIDGEGYGVSPDFYPEVDPVEE